MEARALVMKGFARDADALLTSAEGTEVFDGPGDYITIETEDDATGVNTTDGNIKVDVVGDLRLCGCMLISCLL